MDLTNPPTLDPTTHSRRKFMQVTGGAAALAVAGNASAASRATDDQGRFESDPFSLGVASGDPLLNSVVLWTRLAPAPFEVDGGMPDRDVPVRWTVAATPDLEPVVQTGTTAVEPEHAHSVHHVVEEFDPNTEYYYQFQVGDRLSPVGRTKTAPEPDSTVEEFEFAFASCQAWYPDPDRRAVPAHRRIARDSEVLRARAVTSPSRSFRVCP